ncbi:MAG: hypothetical protein H6838_06470 [Planctomycetes bacterium]|nr:hypothetical protein [Planctomycetota bacterium]
MHRRVPAVGALCAVLSAPLVAQNWVQLFPNTSPPGVAGHGMAYDFVNDRTVSFGGGTAAGRVSDTWLFDGVDWSQATPATSPPPRAAHPLAYDLGRGRVVLFGGIGVGTGVLNDTWEWDGVTWTQMTPATVPPARRSMPLVYHPGRGTCVMHGGYGTATLNDTWEWNGVDWVQIVTANYPTPLRYATDMAYDPVGNGLVLFSGYPGSTQDTWYFDNVDWTQRVTTNVPPGRYDHTMVTDPIRNRVVLFGGQGAADTWEFDGTDWSPSPATTLPPARADDYMVYDWVRGQVVMFGGSSRDDTWAYQTPAQPGFAAAIPYGEGCLDEASASVYELFAANSFDLSNTTLQFLPTNNGYAVLQVPPQWFTPVAPSLGLTDDSVSAALPLGFTLNYPGGSTTDVYASSNGFVRAQPGGNSECCNGDAALLLAGLPRWAGVWCDLNPSAGGTTHFDTDPANGAAYVTFLNVPEYGQTGTQTFQVAFFSSGIVELRFQNCAASNHTVLTGWSPGGGVGDPGSIDLSAITAPIITSPDKVALRHRSDLRPVLGNTLSLSTSPLPAGTILTATLFGLAEFNPGIDLTPLGMPGCYQFASIDATQIALPVGNVASTNFNVPNLAGLAGVEIKSQGVSLVPGINVTGAVTSNGLKMTIDAN